MNAGRLGARPKIAGPVKPKAAVRKVFYHYFHGIYLSLPSTPYGALLIAPNEECEAIA